MPQWMQSLTWIKDYWYLWLIGLWAMEVLVKYLESKGIVKPGPESDKLSAAAWVFLSPFLILFALSMLWWVASWLLSFVSWVQTWSWAAFSAWSFSAWYHSLGWLGRLWIVYGFASLGLFMLVIFMEVQAMKVAGASGWSFFGWLMLSIIGLMLLLLATAINWAIHPS